MLGSDVIKVDSLKLKNFLSLYEPVSINEMEEDVGAEPFLRGNTRSFKPFSLQWHFERKEIDKIVNIILNKKIKDNKPNIIRVEANPGSGRTFTILASIDQLIRKHRALAIKIPSHSYKSIPSVDELNDFLKEVFNSVKSRGLEEPKHVVFWAEYQLDEESLSLFKKLSSNIELESENKNKINIPINLIYEGIGSSQNKQEKNIFAIQIDNDLSIDHKKELAVYILRTTRNHKLPQITEDEIVKIITEEKTFLPIVYRALDPAKRSINKIINDTFNNIKQKELIDLISICSLSSSIDIDIPVAVVKRALSEIIGKNLSYPDIFKMAETNESKTFIKQSEDTRTNPLFSIYHSLVAQHICRLIGTKRLNDYLINIAKSVELKSRIEGEFISNLFIFKGVNWEQTPGIIRPFSDRGLEDAFSAIIDRQPARPLLHHFARLYYKKNPNHKEIIPLLEQALTEPKEIYSLEERKENILTTLAYYRWNKNKRDLLSKPRENQEIQEIIDMLINARENMPGNIHAYDVHINILLDLLKNCKDDEKKLTIMNESLEVINEGFDECYGDPDSIQRLNERRMEIMLEIDYKNANNIAKQLFEQNKDGTGYYYLANYEYYKNSNQKKAIELLDIALKAEKCPSGAIFLRLEIDLLDSYNKDPDYNYLLKLVNRLSTDSRFLDNWKSAYLKAAILTIKDKYKEAQKFFTFSRRNAPKNHRTRVRVFWMEKGHRKMHKGKISSILTEREGRIYSHGIDGWNDDIYFDPRSQELKKLLKSGDFVNFELGFNPMGPIAFDVRPSAIKKFR
jgi:hypothetical protein